MKKMLFLFWLCASSWAAFSQQLEADSTSRPAAPDSLAVDTTWRVMGAANFTFSNSETIRP